MNSFTEKTKKLFEQISTSLFQELKGNEELNLNLSAEDQTYLRLNNSKIRQATNVEQSDFSLTLQANGKTTESGFQLSGNLETDLQSARSILARLKNEIDSLPNDPFQVGMQNCGQSDQNFNGEILPAEKAIQLLTQKTEGSEFTGLYAAGPMIRANRNSKGQSHWFSTESFFIDYSLYTVNSAGENKAVKAEYADTKWNDQAFLNGFQNAKNQLSLLKKPSKKVAPGQYKTYLAPAAAGDLFNMMSWGALSYASLKRGQCAFQKLQDGHEKLSEKLTVTENFALGISPQFNSIGEVAPMNLSMIEKGQLKNFLISARTAKEYGVESNGADANAWFGEYLRSLDVQTGKLAEKDILKELGTGLFLGNLHYLNWSDIQSARVTGMTRYACFWVDGGEIVAPIQDMRFDESLFHAFGSELMELTSFSSLMMNVDTYGKRALGGKKIPGLLLNEFKLTL
jgi:predicted Zn-dependent protease